MMTKNALGVLALLAACCFSEGADAQSGVGGGAGADGVSSSSGPSTTTTGTSVTTATSTSSYAAGGSGGAGGGGSQGTARALECSVGDWHPASVELEQGSLPTGIYGNSDGGSGRDSTACVDIPVHDEACLFGVTEDNQGLPEGGWGSLLDIDLQTNDQPFDAAAQDIVAVRFTLTGVSPAAPVHFGIEIAYGDEWIPFRYNDNQLIDVDGTYTVAFSEMTLAGWASANIEFDPTSLAVLIFVVDTVNGETTPYDFCVSDLAFLDEDGNEVEVLTWGPEGSADPIPPRDTRQCNNTESETIEVEPGKYGVPNAIQSFGDSKTTMCLDVREPATTCLYGLGADSDDGMGNEYAYWGSGFSLVLGDTDEAIGWDAETLGIAGVRYTIAGLVEQAPVRFQVGVASIDGVPFDEFPFVEGVDSENDMTDDGIYTVWFSDLAWPSWFELPEGVAEDPPSFDPSNLDSVGFNFVAAPGETRPYEFCVSDVAWIDEDGHEVAPVTFGIADDEPEQGQAGAGGEGGGDAAKDSGDSGGSGGSGGTGGSGGSAGEGSHEKKSSGGCGCRLAPSSTPHGWLWLPVGMLAWRVRRRWRRDARRV